MSSVFCVCVIWSVLAAFAAALLPEARYFFAVLWLGGQCKGQPKLKSPCFVVRLGLFEFVPLLDNVGFGVVHASAFAIASRIVASHSPQYTASVSGGR